MAERVTRKRRKLLQLQAERMRAAKTQRLASVQETPVETPAEEPLPGPSGLNESVLLPAPDADDDSLTESGSDDDYGSDFTREDADAAYQDWIVTMDVKMMAMMLHDNCTSRFGLTNMSAAADHEVAQLLGFNEKLIRTVITHLLD